ncbi:FAD binding 1 and/or NAD binding 1 domain containing protein, partial [Asbolus verrucosus]
LFLKSLARFVTDPQELEKIQQLCAPKASQEYTDLIAGAGATLLGLLDTFPSCQPPVEIILENVPPLQPRFYSISSSPLESNKIEITFFVVVHNDGRKGVCTGWLQRLIQNKTGDLVPFYFRQPTKFRLATEPPPPTILIATGTGIAPFRGFLQHRSLLGGDHERIWLFYGCRYPDRDYLYKKDIDSYLQQGVLTKLDLAFSREGENKNYVQHNIDRHGVEFVDWLLKIDAQLFVCGDAKTVQKDVKAAIINNLIKHGCMSEAGADDFVRELESRAKFVVDAWL